MLFNDPKKFREEMLKGYVAANRNYVMEVSGGVVRATETPEGKVAVINGGGSGHYPAFCGIIGHGFMDGTVVGNIFTSPSTDDVLSVARAVENGAGVFIVGGNYAGDKINFNLARDALIEEGIDARSFYITDDVASASKEEIEKRRGNVGTFTVFKTAGAASDAGYSFDDIVRVTEKANDMTRTMSIGMKGCTLPGAGEPLFHVPEGKIEVGQGIHGEAGVYESDALCASETAEVLVKRVLDEKPDTDSKKIAVILDGLGSTKYEELFVVYQTVDELLKEAGYELVEPQVGEFVTSLDMAGIALSVTWLDDELERFWKYPADTAGFKKGNVESSALKKRVITEKTVEETYQKASEASRKAAKKIVKALEAVKDRMASEEKELAKIDAVAGDGDHGRGMVKGSSYAAQAARKAYELGAGAGSTLVAAGKSWAKNAGGTSGVLWGSALEKAGKSLGDTFDKLTLSDISDAVKAGKDRMVELGGAKPGDKTMLDVLLPFSKALEKAVDDEKGIRSGWKKGLSVAKEACEKTKDMIPKVGRARPQAERSVGTPDAGAVSMTMAIESAMADEEE